MINAVARKTDKGYVMGLRFRVVLSIAVAVSGGLLATVASAASASKTSVSLQFASHTSFKGRVGSPKAGCVRSRVIRLQMREGRKWFSIATAESNHSGRFHGTFHRGGGRYRAVAGVRARARPGHRRP